MQPLSQIWKKDEINEKYEDEYDSVLDQAPSSVSGSIVDQDGHVSFVHYNISTISIFQPT